VSGFISVSSSEPIAVKAFETAERGLGRADAAAVRLDGRVVLRHDDCLGWASHVMIGDRTVCIVWWTGAVEFP